MQVFMHFMHPNIFVLVLSFFGLLVLPDLYATLTKVDKIKGSYIYPSAFSAISCKS